MQILLIFGVLLNCVSYLGNVYFHVVYIGVVYSDFDYQDHDNWSLDHDNWFSSGDTLTLW